MQSLQNYLISQAGRPICVVEATDSTNALNRAKGLGNVLELAPSLPMTAAPVIELPEGLPAFKTEYFELMGFKK